MIYKHQVYVTHLPRWSRLPKIFCHSSLILQFAMSVPNQNISNNLHLVASLVTDYIRKENDLLTAEVKKLDRRLRLHQHMYRMLDSQHAQLGTEFLTLRRVLREIFTEDPEMRIHYRPVVYFSDLETDSESEDDEEERQVRRRLSYSEDYEVIDLTNEQ
jgi:hypothetical protein